MTKLLLDVPSLDFKYFNYSDLNRFLLNLIVQHRFYSEIENKTLVKIIFAKNPGINKAKLVLESNSIMKKLFKNNCRVND